MTYRAYLKKMDIALHARAVGSTITFDGTSGTWTRGKHVVRSSDVDGKTVRFQLFTVGRTETLVGSYSGTIGSTPDSVAQYLIYFLETGKPWHRGLSNRGLG
jgi:hypothetical protein